MNATALKIIRKWLPIAYHQILKYTIVSYLCSQMAIPRVLYRLRINNEMTLKRLNRHVFRRLTSHTPEMRYYGKALGLDGTYSRPIPSMKILLLI